MPAPLGLGILYGCSGYSSSFVIPQCLLFAAYRVLASQVDRQRSILATVGGEESTESAGISLDYRFQLVTRQTINSGAQNSRNRTGAAVVDDVLG
jgi:hypothetical protein